MLHLINYVSNVAFALVQMNQHLHCRLEARFSIGAAIDGEFPIDPNGNVGAGAGLSQQFSN